MVNVGFRLISNIVLAHLLLPRDFGLVAITSFVATGLAMVTDIGSWLSVVRKKNAITDDWLRQLWTLQVVRGLLLWALAAGSAVFIARAYSDWALTVLLPVTGVTLAVQGLQSLKPMVSAASLDPLPNIKMQLSGQVVGSTTSIIWAFVQPDAWALVAGLIAGASAQTILSFVWTGDRPPRPLLTRKFLSEQLRLAAWLGASSGIGFFAAQIDRIAFPALYGVTAFGVYGLAGVLALLPLQLGQRWSDSIYMPVLAHGADADPNSHRRQLRQLGQTASTYMALGAGVLAGVGRPFFDALYPALYEDAGIFVRVLATATYAALLTYLHRRQFLFYGRMKIELAVESMRILLFVGGLAIAMAAPGKLSPLAYVALYALVQLAVYAAVLLVGRLKLGLHVRDDLPAHFVFVSVAVSLMVIDAAVTRGLGAFTSLIITGTAGVAICIFGAFRLGLPKLPTMAGGRANAEC